jgi:hypothetical protein
VVAITKPTIGQDPWGTTLNAALDDLVDAVTDLEGHSAAPDPHTQYLTSSEGAAAYAALSHNHSGVYLPLAGGTVTGTVALTGTAKVTQVAAPTADVDLTTKDYVDQAILDATPAPTDLSHSAGFILKSAGVWPARSTCTSDTTRMVIWKGPAPGPTFGGNGAVTGVDTWFETAS